MTDDTMRTCPGCGRVVAVGRWRDPHRWECSAIADMMAREVRCAFCGWSLLEMLPTRVLLRKLLDKAWL